MRSTFKVLFYLKRGSEKRNGEVTIMARVTVDGKICQFSTKQDIHPDNWNVKAGKATGKSAGQLNKLLDDIKASLHQIYHEQQRRDNYVTAEKVKNEFLGHSENHETLLNLFEKHNNDVKALIGISKSASTFQKYEVTRKHLENFIQYKYKLSDMALKEINLMFITDFEVYLKTIGKCNANTTAKFMQFFKRIILIARNNGIIIGDPFANYKIRIQRVDRGYLTEDEIKKILELNLVSERLEHVRDLFIFSCFCGLAFSDIKGLKPEHIVRDNNGALWIRKKRQKTGNMCNIPLLDHAKEILDLYKKHPVCLERGVLLPVLCNQKMNAYLAELADICGIKKHISTHTGRHSFATSVALANGVSIENVAKMLGHSDTKMTRHYARVLDKSIMRDMTIVNGKFAAKPETPPVSPQEPVEDPNPVATSAPSAVPSIEIPVLIPHSRSGIVN